MGNAFDRFTADLVSILKTRGVAGLEEIAAKLKPLLLDPDFPKIAFPDETMHKRILFHDPETDVYVQAHLQEGGKAGKPHSHGASWAVYGNISGVTNMTEYRRVDDAATDHAVLEPVSNYRLGPGDSRAYPPHAIHSTQHPEKAYVIRVTGTNLDNVARYSFDANKDKISDARSLTGIRA